MVSVVDPSAKNIAQFKRTAFLKTDRYILWFLRIQTPLIYAMFPQPPIFDFRFDFRFSPPKSSRAATLLASPMPILPTTIPARTLHERFRWWERTSWIEYITWIFAVLSGYGGISSGRTSPELIHAVEIFCFW